MIPLHGVTMSKVSLSIHLLRRLPWFLSRQILVLFFKSCIMPSFDYCDVVWDVCTKHEAERLERLQNYAARCILRRRRDLSATEDRKQLSLSTLQSRWTLHLAQCTYKSIKDHKHHPVYLSELFSTPDHQHNTRNKKSNINLPLKKSGFGQHAFSFRGVSIWRSLPKSAREASTLDHFTSLINLFRVFEHDWKYCYVTFTLVTLCNQSHLIFNCCFWFTRTICFFPP